MTKSTLILILASVSLSALAQVSFKLGVTASVIGGAESGAAAKLVHSIFNPGVIVGLALYAFGTLLWLTALGQVEVSQAYPFVGVGFVLTAILGYVLFGDALSLQRIAGILVIIGGIVLVAQS